MKEKKDRNEDAPMVPRGKLIYLGVHDLRPSPHNPRRLFDPEPLAVLKKSIGQHGVLVPLTIYPLPGQKKYAIVDGERRYRCCSDLSNEGADIQIPANVVAPPDSISSLIYMFNIHQFRQQWELMPTAIALRSVIEELKTNDDRELTELTGLGARQVERCKIILSFPDRYQKMSLDSDPMVRIPSNFWVELHPVLDLVDVLLPDLAKEESRDGITNRLIEKYRKKMIKSVIHFRRILEAYDVQEDKEGRNAVADRLRDYILRPDLETRAAFDDFITDRRRVQKATQATDKFLSELRKARIDHATDDKNELIQKLTSVIQFVQDLLEKLEGEDPPQEEGT